MSGIAKGWFTAMIAALIGPLLLAGAAPPRPSAGPPKAAPPAPKPAPHASAEPTEAQLPPVDPAWRRHGWRAVVPHGYVLRGLAPARVRPEASAPVVFWLKGGVRVPILEQRSEWWRVGWTHGLTGWMPAAELQPHASFVLIDVRTGRVLRRLAAKGEQGPVSDGRFLWSLSDTGITRTALGEPPAIWSVPVAADAHGSLPEEGVWTPGRTRFFVDSRVGHGRALVEAFVRSGAVRRTSLPDDNQRLVGAEAKGRVLLEGASHVRLYDPRLHQEIRRAPGWAEAVAKSGASYAYVGHATGKRELIHYDPDLQRLGRLKLAEDLSSARLSTDERVIALRYQRGSRIELRRCNDLTRLATLHPDSDDEPDFYALSGGPRGWWSVVTAEGGSGASITHYMRQGRRIHTWHSDSPGITVSPNGRWICMTRKSDVLVVDTARGTTRRIPFTWRRPLPRRYLPKPSDPDTPTHLDISALTLTPDGRTLILTEWLNGDPEG